MSYSRNKIKQTKQIERKKLNKMKKEMRIYLGTSCNKDHDDVVAFHM